MGFQSLRYVPVPGRPSAGICNHGRRSASTTASSRSPRATPPARRLHLLRVAADAPVLSVIVTAYDATARPIQVSDLVLPGERHELRDAYPFT